ncbi:MAG: hypothetical protein RLZZ299_2451 [Pseudomonadota bacterium]
MHATPTVLLPLLAALSVGVAHAEEPSSLGRGGEGPPATPPLGAENPAAGPRLPALRAPVPAAWPADAPPDATRGEVVLALDLDATGAVAKAAIATSGGPAFDAAALALAPALAFTPALDDTGAPAPASIQFRVVFTRTVVGVQALRGTLRDEAGAGLANAEVRLVGPDGAPRTVRSGPDGRFALEELSTGTWLVAAVAPGFQTQATSVEVAAGRVTLLDLVLLRDEENVRGSDTLDIVRERTPPEVTERVLSVEEIRYLPGTNGDVVKVVQNLPGVARPPLGIGQLIIRGTAPEDSQYTLDGGGIPIVFHFSGLTTVVNSDLVAEVAYLPGNFGVRYGRVLGGLVDIRTDDTLPEKNNGNLAVDVYQSTAFVEARVGDRTAVSFSARRSYVDVFLDPIFEAMGNGTTIRTPRYWDAQARVVHRARGGTFDALLLASDDGFRFSGANDGDGLSFGTSFQKLRLRWAQDLPGGWSSETVLVGGPQDNTFDVGKSGEAWERPVLGNLRQEFVRTADTDRPVGWRLGTDVLGGVDRFLYDVERFGTKREEGDTPLLAPAAYAEATVRAGDWTFIPGLRADALVLRDLAKFAVDPRFVAKLDAAPGTLVKASVGRYSQWPTTRQLTPSGDGNADLTAPWSLQSSLGVEQVLPWDLTFESNAFYNVLNDLVVGREDRFAFFTGPPPSGPFDLEGYANAGSGMVCGLEGLLKRQTADSVALLAVTGSHSERTNRSGEERLFRYDQPLVVNALVSRELNRGWRLGSRVRFTSGDPFTPVVNRLYDLDSRRFFPVYGKASSERLPPFWSVDLRVDKDFSFRSWTLTAYLDLQNAFYAKNVEVMSWSYDFAQETPITGNPPLPAFGVKGSF